MYLDCVLQNKRYLRLIYFKDNKFIIDVNFRVSYRYCFDDNYSLYFPNRISVKKVTETINQTFSNINYIEYTFITRLLTFFWSIKLYLLIC